MVNVVYGCCVGSREKLDQYVVPRVGDRELITLYDQTSITAAYNEILGRCRGRDLDVLVLLHDDLEITDPDFIEKISIALTDPDVAVVGVAGGRGVGSLAWWSAETTYGHQLTDSGMVELGPRTGVVDALEGSVLALSPWAIENLRFDERYDGFHAYDCDISFQVRHSQKRVVVVDVDTHHHTTLGFRSNDVRRSWLRADELFRQKWNLGGTNVDR